MNAMLTSRKCESGQSLVELALLMPLLLLLVLGIVDLGRVFNAYIAITNASREGALCGSFYPPGGVADAGVLCGSYYAAGTSNEVLIRERVLREARPTVLLDLNRIQITSTGGAPGSPVTVTVQYPFAAVSLTMQSFLPGGNPFMLTATTAMMVRK
jgi:Flp pilus assembly protein TadG